MPLAQLCDSAGRIVSLLSSGVQSLLLISMLSLWTPTQFLGIQSHSNNRITLLSHTHLNRVTPGAPKILEVEYVLEDERRPFGPG